MNVGIRLFRLNPSVHAEGERVREVLGPSALGGKRSKRRSYMSHLKSLVWYGISEVVGCCDGCCRFEVMPAQHPLPH